MMLQSEFSIPFRRIFVGLIAGLIGFSVVAKGGHDLWAATFIYVAILGLIIARTMLSPGRLSRRIHLPLMGAALFLIFNFGLSYRGSINPSESFISFMDWMTMLGMFFLVSNIFEFQEDTTLFMGLMVPIFWIESAVMFIQWINIAFRVKNHLMPYEEPPGTFPSPNSTVAFALIFLPSLLEKSGLGFRNHSRWRWYWLSGVVSLSLVILMVFSTWSFVCLTIGILLMAGGARLKQAYRQHQRIFTILFVSTGIILTLLLINKLFSVFGWGGIVPHRIHPTSRLNWWMSGLKIWMDHPWLGVGIGNYPSAYLAYKTGSGQNTLYAHSFLIQILSETGLIGFSAIFLFLFQCFRRMKTCISEQKKPLFAGLIILLLYSLIQISFEYLSHLMLLGLTMGILVGHSNSDRTWVPRIPWKILIAVTGACALPYIVSPFLASRLWVDGNNFLLEKKYDLASERFRSALVLDGRSWESYWGLAQIATVQGEIDSAILYSRQALSQNKLNLKIQQELNRLLAFSQGKR